MNPCTTSLRPRPSALSLLSLLSLVALAAGCGSTKASTAPDDAWIEPSVSFQRQIDEQAARVPYLQRPEDFVDVIGFFVQAGEAAYPTLLELAAAEDPRAASTALAALGESRDARLVAHIRAIPWPPESERKLRYERARCLVKLGDWSPIELLVDGLEDDELLPRAQCFKALHQATNETFDYHPQGPEEERAAAVGRWRAWLAERELDGLLE